MPKKSRKPQPGRRAGNLSWAQGSKDEFLKSHLDDWLEAHKTKRATEFYDRITTVFVTMYGYDLPIKQDGPRLVNEDEISIEDMPQPVISEEEADRQSAFRAELRIVSGPFLSVLLIYLFTLSIRNFGHGTAIRGRPSRFPRRPAKSRNSFKPKAQLISNRANSLSSNSTKGSTTRKE